MNTYNETKAYIQKINAEAEEAYLEWCAIKDYEALHQDEILTYLVENEPAATALTNIFNTSPLTA